MTFDELNAADDIAVGDDVFESEVGEGLELLLNFRGRRLRGGIVKYQDVLIVMPPPRKPAGAQGGGVNLADEKGVLAFAIPIRGPEEKLVSRLGGRFVKDHWA